MGKLVKIKKDNLSVDKPNDPKNPVKNDDLVYVVEIMEYVVYFFKFILLIFYYITIKYF